MPWEERPKAVTKSFGARRKTPSFRGISFQLQNSIFNSAVITFGDEYRGVFRVDNTA